MKSKGIETKIVLQVGSELRVNNKGDIIIDNPELELAREPEAAEADIFLQNRHTLVTESDATRAKSAEIQNYRRNRAPSTVQGPTLRD